mmetsp:Transcript_28329/g.72825  ORF Transcript_28329/g.72825 Transcript_28329/m.72825 type:complete len:266 (-) Transcript_28329:669-1466(-)
MPKPISLHCLLDMSTRHSIAISSKVFWASLRSNLNGVGWPDCNCLLPMKRARRAWLGDISSIGVPPSCTAGGTLEEPPACFRLLVDLRHLTASTATHRLHFEVRRLPPAVLNAAAAKNKPSGAWRMPVHPFMRISRTGLTARSGAFPAAASCWMRLDGSWFRTVSISATVAPMEADSQPRTWAMRLAAQGVNGRRPSSGLSTRAHKSMGTMSVSVGASMTPSWALRCCTTLLRKLSRAVVLNSLHVPTLNSAARRSSSGFNFSKQ